MATYAELDSLIVDLKLAAIDAYMTGWDKDGDEYKQSTYALYGGTEYVTMPGDDANGGGEIRATGWTVIPDDMKDDYKNAFNTIRSRIDTALAPWHGLPDPDEIGKEVEKCRQVTRGLSGAASASAGTATGAGVLGSNITLIEQNMIGMTGTAMAAFKATCLARLAPTIGGLHAISLVQGAAIAAEQKLWEDARKLVVEVVTKTTTAMNQVYEAGQGSEWDLLLTVAGVAAKGLAIFATGGVGKAVQVAGLGIELLSGSEAAPEEKAKVGDCDSTLSGFEEMLGKINSHIKSEEEKLQKNLTNNDENIRNDKSSYDITTDPITLSEIKGGDIHIDYGLIDEITGTYMPKIATELGRISQIDIEALIFGIARDGSLGIGAMGPTTEWDTVNILLWELLNSLQWDVQKSGKNLDLAADDLRTYDSDTSADLQKVAGQLGADSNPYEPW